MEATGAGNGPPALLAGIAAGAIEKLCAQESAAAAELDDLFLDATVFDTSFGDPEDPDMGHYDPFDDDAGDAQGDLQAAPPQHSDAL